MKTQLSNQIQFKLANAIAELSSYPRFDDYILKLSTAIRCDYQKYAVCEQELQLFADALYVMATVQGSLEIAEDKMAQARTSRIEHGPTSGEMEKAAIDVYARTCKQKTEEASAAYLHLVFRLNRLMESVEYVASTNSSKCDSAPDGVTVDERGSSGALPFN